MWARKRMAPASDDAREGGLSRRAFLTGVAALALAPSLAGAKEGEPSDAGALSDAARRALAQSPYVYVSPLRSDGEESACHGEVWFAWLDDTVVLTTSTTTWKARAVARGLDRARLWVGDYGRWKRPFGRNESFREGPRFEARARAFQDPALLERLLGVYREKYPDEIGRWAPRFRTGHADGTRILIAYEPI